MCLLARLKKKLTIETSGIRLNYLTLGLNDKVVLKDFEMHRTAYLNRASLFWVS
jgi:hypothetical protein